MMTDQTVISYLRETLADATLPDDGAALLAWAETQYGPPEIDNTDPATRQSQFSLPDGRDLRLLTDIKSGDLVGGFVLKQVAAPPPCPTPGPMGVRVITGSFSERYNMLPPWAPANAHATAMMWAWITLMKSYNLVVPIFCRPCPPPCTCTTSWGLPTITTTHTLRWRWGIVPVGGTWTVAISLPVTFACV